MDLNAPPCFGEVSIDFVLLGGGKTCVEAGNTISVSVLSEHDLVLLLYPLESVEKAVF